MSRWADQKISIAFVKMLRKQPVDDVTVIKVCEKAGVNRQSFYYHFKDKYDLVNWIFYVGFLGEMDMSSYQTGWDWVEDICRYFYREKDFYRVALKIEGQNSFRDYFMEITAPVASLFLQDVLPSKEEESFFVTFVLDAFLAALVRWLSGGYDHEMDADEFTSRMKEILHRVGDTIPE